MLVTPLPGSDRTNLINVLRQVRSKAINARSTYEQGRETHAFLTWAHETGNALRSLITQADIDRLVYTPRYWTLISAPNPEAQHMLMLKRDELDHRIAEFEALIPALEDLTTRWSSKDIIIVPDTGFFVAQTPFFDEYNLWELFGVSDSLDLHLAVPMQVVSELDRLKEAKGHQRGRANVAIAILNRIMAGNPRRVQHIATAQRQPGQAQSGMAVGTTTIEILFDPPGRQRITDADQEILDRAAAVQVLSGKPNSVMIATFDTEMALEARAIGLQVAYLRVEKQLEDDEKVERAQIAKAKRIGR